MITGHINDCITANPQHMAGMELRIVILATPIQDNTHNIGYSSPLIKLKRIRDLVKFLTALFIFRG